MDYHIVSGKNETSHSPVIARRQHPKTDRHFMATLFGAAVFMMLVLPLTNAYKNETSSQVLGAQSAIATKVYDSELGYYDPAAQQSQESTDIFTILIRSLLSLFE